jgi:hypothetical protein
MFGIETIITYQPVAEIDFETPLVEVISQQFQLYGWEDQIVKGTTSALEPNWFTYDYSTFRPINTLYYSSYASAPMNVNRYDSIYIRSSLQSNIWEKDGHRSDKLAVIPMTNQID